MDKYGTEIKFTLVHDVVRASFKKEVMELLELSEVEIKHYGGFNNWVEKQHSDVVESLCEWSLIEDLLDPAMEVRMEIDVSGWVVSVDDEMETKIYKLLEERKERIKQDILGSVMIKDLGWESKDEQSD